MKIRYSDIYARKNIVRAMFFIVAVVIISYFLPRTDNVHLSYQPGRPWPHTLLTAPFDIPVYRDSTTTQLLIDSINENFESIYRLNSTPRDTLISRIRKSQSLSTTQKSRLTAVIDTLYRHGVTDRTTVSNMRRHANILILSGNVLHSHPSREVKSLREAYAWIDSMVREPASRHALQQMQLSRLMLPSLVLDTVETARLYNERIQPVTAAISVIQTGERIIDRGDVVTPQLDMILTTYETMASDRYNMSTSQRVYNILGQLMLATIIMSLLFCYLHIYRKDIFDNLRTLLAIETMIVFFYLMSAVSSQAIAMGIFLVPLAMIAILMVVFFDSATALFIYMLEVLLCSCFTTFALEFVVIEMVVGMATIFSLRELSRRSQLLRTAVIVFVTYVVTYTAIELMATATLNSFSWRLIGYFAINMVLITFAYILIFVFEKVFGLISSVTLVELSDINTPLLKQLSEQCPGTFQHSMAVSNLASNAADRIGANVQLVRAGALYHDIGKINNPAFFTENQYGINPHDALEPEQSARVLHAHVTDGMRMADKEKLPRVVRDLIAQHHGSGKAKYFYAKFQKQHPDEVIDDALFTYPGPNPQTREASLLMMADSVEAASRSMTDHSPEAITKLVNNIIDAQVEDGLHRESPLSFRDIMLAKEAFINRLRTMYHSRIAYPPSSRKS